MKKTFLSIFLMLLLCFSLTSSVFATASPDASLDVYIKNDYIVAHVYLHTDTYVDSCGIEYTFDSELLTFDCERSFWTVPGILESFIDYNGDYVGVWTIETIEGINFSKEELPIVTLIFKLNNPLETTTNINVELITLSGDKRMCYSVNGTVEPLYNNPSSFMIEYYYIDSEKHLVMMNNIPYVEPHVILQDNTCFFCHHQISVVEDILVIEPQESATEEEE